MPDGRLTPLTRHQPSTAVEDGCRGASGTIGFIARQWASPSAKEQQYQQGIPCDYLAKNPMDLGIFLSRLKTHMFSISCMVFQDAWNLDLERVQDCCIHVFSPDGRLIPFCMYNLTDVDGRSLYRNHEY
nr:hypothetical protein [Desulforapulum autotrophicum]